ncbi:MAG TPA: LEA type 2 family protein [Steroidobacteraceae bacterium]|jgi:LEA14-like dessication related protein
MRAIAGAAALALLGGGCALAPKLTTPTLTIVGVKLEGSDLLAQRLKVRVHVQNPNDRTLPIKGIEYTLDVDGQPFATGDSAGSFVVPALGEAEFDMNVTTNMAGTLVRLLARPSDARASVPYRLTGKISLSQGWLQSIPFEQHGTFSLQ